MPKYEDLSFLREKIVSIANETEVMRKKGRKPNAVEIPKREEPLQSKSYDDLLDDNLLNDIPDEQDDSPVAFGDEDLMSSVNKEKERSRSLEEAMELEALPEAIEVDSSKVKENSGDFLDNMEDFLGVTEPTNAEEIETPDFLSSLEDSPEAPLSSNDENTSSEDESLSLLENVQEEELVVDEGLKEDDTSPELSLDNLDNNEEILTDKNSSIPMEDMPDLISMGDSLSTSMDDLSLDSLLSGDLSEDTFGDSLLEQQNEPVASIIEETPNVDTTQDVLFSTSQDVENNTSMSIEDTTLEDEKTPSEEAAVQPEEEIPVEDKKESGMPDLPSLDLDDDSIDLSNMLNEESSDDANDDDLLDLSSLDHLDTENSVEPESKSEALEFPEEEPEPVAEMQKDEEPAYDEALSSDDIPVSDTPDNSEENIILDPEDRKKVILTISTFPKDAELKIVNAIINQKYSDQDVYPLVKELIRHGTQEAIIARYEKLTGDKSLHNIALTRLSGEAFERKQKSFLSMLENNVLPILARTAALLVMIAVVVMFYVTIIEPTWTAEKLYNQGKKHINDNKYTEAESCFNEAYRIQPRYHEIIDFARKYREHERNNEAQVKYQMAAELRDDRVLDFEYGDFLRETGNYEKSISMYNYWIKQNQKDLDARNGRGKTYLKWADEDASKLETAEDEFLDVLSDQANNKDAISNILLTYMKMDNRKKVLDTYHWAVEYLKKLDYQMQIKTAGYLIDHGDLNEAKRILTDVAPTVPKKPPYPEYNYQMARYNKALQVRPEEQKYLENAKREMESLSGAEMKQEFGDEAAFNRFKSRVYNDLGENYYDISRTDIRAFKMFDEASKLNPSDGRPLYNKGNFAYRTKADRQEALRYYEEAEKNGMKSDIMTYNMGWLYYKKGDYNTAHIKIDSLLKKNPDIDTLKFMKGTILLKMSQNDLAYSELLEVYDRYNTLRQSNGPLDLDLTEHQNIVRMLYQSSNNLGAALYGKYRETKKHQYFADALRYFTEAVKYFDIVDPAGIARTHSGGATEKAVPYLNLKMALYPDVFGKTEKALADDDFNQYEYFY